MRAWRIGSDDEYIGCDGSAPAGYVLYDGPVRVGADDNLLMVWDGAPRPMTDAEVFVVSQTAAKDVITHRVRSRIHQVTGGVDTEMRGLRWAAQIAKKERDGDPVAGVWAARKATVEALAVAVELIAVAGESMDAEIDTLSTQADIDSYVAGLDDVPATAPRTVEWP